MRKRGSDDEAWSEQRRSRTVVYQTSPDFEALEPVSALLGVVQNTDALCARTERQVSATRLTGASLHQAPLTPRMFLKYGAEMSSPLCWYEPLPLVAQPATQEPRPVLTERDRPAPSSSVLILNADTPDSALAPICCQLYGSCELVRALLAWYHCAM